MPNFYVNFLSAAHLFESSTNPVCKLNEKEKHLLQCIALRSEEGKCMTVTEAMSLSNVASPATIHRKLKNLLSLGFVSHKTHGPNRKTKYLVPTKFTDKYYASLGVAMCESMSS